MIETKIRTATVLMCALSAGLVACSPESGDSAPASQPPATAAPVTTAGGAKHEASGAELAQASLESNLHPEHVKSVARMAFVWAYPMVNMINRRETLGVLPEPGRAYGVLPASPTGQIGMLSDYIDPGQNFIACPNQDVVYGLGFQALDETPVVMQIPEIDDRFWVYAVYDQRTDQVGYLGAMYDTQPGFYLLVGPDWDGEVPDGITDVVHSPTNLAIVIPRLFMDDTDEDRAAIQPIINQVMVYPLADFDGQMKSKIWAEAPSFGEAASGGENKWVRPETFFEQLKDVLEMVPPLPGEEAMYGQMRAVIHAADNDPALLQAFNDAITEVDEKLIPDFLRWEYNGKPAGNNWNRSQNNAEWGLDYNNRTSTSRSNMFDNRPTETQYYYTDYDMNGGQLVGENTYAVRFEAGELPPVKGFWSLTMYNKHHFFYPNELNRYSLGTKNKTLKYGDDGSLTLYVGNNSPGADLESNWIPAPDEEFSIYLRAYWGEEGILDGSWTPPVVEMVN